MGVLFSVITAMLFALANIYNRKASKHIRGFDAIAVSALLNMLLIFPVLMVIRLIQGTPWPDLVTLLIYLLIGVFSVFLGRWTLYIAIALIGPSRASLVKNAAPVFVIVFAFLLFQKLPALIPFIGILIILGGISFLGWEKGEQKKEISSLQWKKGLGLGLLVAMVFATADILRALAMERVPDVILATAMTFLGGFLTIVLILLIQGKLFSTFRQRALLLNRNVLLASTAAGLALITNLIALLYLFVPYVSALVATAPLFTVLFSYLLSRHDEKFGPLFWLTTGLVISGAVCISLYK